VVEHRSRLSREVVESPSLDTVKTQRGPEQPALVDLALSGGWEGELNSLRRSLPTSTILWFLWAFKDQFPKDPACLGLLRMLLVVHKHSLRSGLLWLEMGLLCSNSPSCWLTCLWF